MTGTVPLCFVDTETTGVHPGRRAWEIAIIRREADGTQTEHHMFLKVDLHKADPFALKVGGFYERWPVAVKGWDNRDAWQERVHESEAAQRVERLTRGAHLVGAVPNFDAEVFDAMLRRHGLLPAWHYHLVDVEALAVGYLTGIQQARHSLGQPVDPRPSLPWKSDDLSRACGVEPASDEERHTALGDARWAMRLYDAIVTA
jgi:DNA polymerase III epsilon subunit-like protein